MTALASTRQPEPDDQNGKMGFLDHLEELRARLIRSCLAIGAGMIAAFAFRDRIAEVVLMPTLNALPPGTSLVATRIWWVCETGTPAMTMTQGSCASS